jgi:O-antigen/teichoic acid export membrane protein
MRLEAQSAVRNSGILIVQQGAEAVIGLLVALVIPRLMGPEVYGKYALITSISLLFVLSSRLGFREVIIRYVPQWREDPTALRSFFSSLVTIRASIGLFAAILFFVIAWGWLRDFSVTTLALTAGTVVFRAISELMMTLFVGLNRAGRWGTSSLLRRWLSFVSVVVGFWVMGLEGAMLGWLAVEIFLWGLGLIWTRSFISHRALAPHIKQMMPFLRFGLTYFLSSLFLSAFRRSGEVLVQILTDDYAEVGYFGLAYNVYLTAALVMPNLTLAFAPFLTRYVDKGRAEELESWVERLLKGLAVGAMLIVFATLLLAGDAVPLVLGDAYRPVAGHLIPLAVTLLFLALSSVAQMLLLIFEAPRQVLAGSIIRVGLFWTVAIPLIRRYQSLGACIAVLVASIGYSLYLTSRAMQHRRYRMRGWVVTVVAALPFLSLLVFRGAWIINLGLYAGFLMAYGGLVLGLRLVTVAEIQQGWRILTGTMMKSNDNMGLSRMGGG